jgi:hypothetical protein
MGGRNAELQACSGVLPALTCRGSLAYLRLFTMQSFQTKKEKGFLQKKKSWRVKGSLSKLQTIAVAFSFSLLCWFHCE